MSAMTPWRKDGNGSGALANQPDHPLSVLRNEFDTLFDRFFGNWPSTNAGPSWWGMQTDETDGEVTVRMDAPGFEAGDFDIQISGDTLRVSAERKCESKEKGEKGEKERFERRFQRSMTLPAAVDADKVQASFKNGVLQLTMPKTEKAKWKKIKVQG